MARHHRIAILMGQDLGYCRHVLTGIQAYAASKPGWTFRDSPPDIRLINPMLDWKPDGIIAHLFDRKLAKALEKLNIPVVNTTSTLPDNPFPLVEVDHDKVGSMAATHFLERGFQNFGFLGNDWSGFSKGREGGFRDELARHGFKVDSCYAEFLPRLSSASSWQELDKRILKWLKKLPKPAAILASNDIPAKELMHACRHLELEVPSEVSILGVDNDEIECHLASPPLSSIELPAQRIGHEAARMLDLLIHNRPLEQPYRFLPPTRVVTRQSTDTVAVDDSQVASAITFIRRHALEGINVSDVVKDIPLSRRSLERRFHSVIGHSILRDIRMTRIEHVKALLARTDLSMPLIAERTGFSTAAHMCHVFRQFTNQSPSAYRRSIRVS